MPQSLPVFPRKVRSVSSKESIDWLDRLRTTVNEIVIGTSPVAGGTITGAIQYRNSSGGFGGDNSITTDGTGNLNASRGTIGNLTLNSNVLSSTGITLQNTSSGGLTFSNLHDSIITIGATFHATRNPYTQSFIKMNTLSSNVLISAPPSSSTQLYFNLPSSNGTDGQILRWTGSGASSILAWDDMDEARHHTWLSL